MTGTPSSSMTVDGERRWQQLGAFAVVALITLLAYARSLTASFQFDDYTVLVAQEEGHLSTWADFVSFARARIVPFATFAANYWIGGRDLFGYHLVNTMVHLLTAFFVYQLAFALCRTPRVRGTWLGKQQLPFAVAAAALFALHPIQVQAVTYIVQRVSSMAAMFYVGAVLFYVRARNAELGTGPGRPNRAYAGCILLALGAFLSKENSASLPLAILLAEWVFFDARDASKQLARIASLFVLVLVIPLAWMLLATGPHRLFDLSGSPVRQLGAVVRLLTFRANPSGDVSPLEYFWTQSVVIPRYLRLVALPTGFNVDHDVAVERNLSPAVASGLALLAILLACGFYSLRRSPVVGFGTLWFFVASSVESSFLPIRDVMVEHRMYLAMPGIALTAASGFAWAFRRRQAPALIAAITLALVLATLTFLRNEVWQTHVSLWSDALAKSPQKARVHGNLGMALELAGRDDEAITQYCQALAIDPGNAQVRANLDAALEEQTEAAIEGEGEVTLEAVPIGPHGGTVKMVPPDPCRGR